MALLVRVFHSRSWGLRPQTPFAQFPAPLKGSSSRVPEGASTLVPEGRAPVTLRGASSLLPRP
ncbi:hypothetical protein DD630_12990 [Streptomyces sp. BSE7F]|nr:hypothetical protein DD630_12990 [Streptomyces sp. BSE7F]